MEQQDFNIIPEGLMKKLNQNSKWYIKYRRLIVPVLLFIVAITVLIIINTNQTVKPTTKSSISKPSPVSLWNQNYGSILTSLNNDISSINTQITNQSYTGQEAVCQQLATDSNNAAAIPIIPDPTAESEFTNAINNLKQAAQLCVSGTQIYLTIADNYKPTVELQAVNDMNSFTTYFEQGSAQTQALNSRIKSLTE